MGGCGVVTDGELKVIGVGERGKRAANFIGEKRKRESVEEKSLEWVFNGSSFAKGVCF